jgi:hypothetical protein
MIFVASKVAMRVDLKYGMLAERALIEIQGSNGGGKDACQGDSGGPMICGIVPEGVKPNGLTEIRQERFETA